jgi:hypothetical protein
MRYAPNLLSAALLFLTTPLAAAQLLVAEIARVDLSPYTSIGPGGGTQGPVTSGGFIRYQKNTAPSYIGTNPSAVAWNGFDLWIAGFNGNTSSQTVGIVRVPGAFQPVSGITSLEPAFGKQLAPTQRGYTGLDLQHGYVYAAYDPGAVHPQGISSYDLFGKFRWAKSARGSCGVGYDPGFPPSPAGGIGVGVGHLAFGANGRALQANSNGADLFTTATGMSLVNSRGTFWRDLDFDPLTGDAYVREGNNVLRGFRSGPNSIGFTLPIVDVPDADFVIGQNIAYCDRALGLQRPRHQRLHPAALQPGDPIPPPRRQHPRRQFLRQPSARQLGHLRLRLACSLRHFGDPRLHQPPSHPLRPRRYALNAGLHGNAASPRCR